MKNKMKSRVGIVEKILTPFNAPKFCNVAEGTHAGHITLTANSDITQSCLLVKFTNGKVDIAELGDIPVGVCTDSADEGEVLDVALAGAAESTLMCAATSSISAGDIVYSQDDGKVGATASAGSVKIGIALCDASSGGFVEVDPQGFGQKSAEIVACGSHTWTGSTDQNSIDLDVIKSGDIAFANIVNAASTEKTAKASFSQNLDKLVITLDANGTNGQTKINWLIIRA